MGLDLLPDFEAEVRFIATSRRAGWRPNITYFEDAPSGAQWIVLPIEWCVDGKVLVEGETIPSIAFAKFKVISQEFRAMHQERIKPGREFRIVEASKTVALARVTEILHLIDHV